MQASVGGGGAGLESVTIPKSINGPIINESTVM